MKRTHYIFNSRKIYFASTVALLTAYAISPLTVTAEEVTTSPQEEIVESESNEESSTATLSNEDLIQDSQSEDSNSSDSSDEKPEKSVDSELKATDEHTTEDDHSKTSPSTSSETTQRQIFSVRNVNIYSEGNSSPEIQSFKEDLTAAGFTPWTRPNENYGPETVEYVRNFQAYYSLPITGEGDAATLNKLAEILHSPYQLGNSSRDIQEIKNKLKALGFADHWNVPNQNYGPETVDVVKNFQSNYGLVTNGIVDSVTYNKIEELYQESLILGPNRFDVKEFKEDLTAAGFTPWTRPNENYGPETVEYVKDFQAYYGLPVTGEADEGTQNKLAEVLNSPYQLGNSSRDIQEIKNKLKALGFAEHWNVPNQNYGPETVDVVKNFQSHYGLVANGIVDSVTYNKIEEVYHAPLRLGVSRPDVKEFKEDLTAAGFTPWTRPNENYGPETVEYVKNFQAYYGLPVTGEADEGTQNKLAEVLNSPYQLGNSSRDIQEIKNKLKALGFADHWNTPNENYGPETVDVVKNFQSHYGLVANGIVDNITYHKIDEVLNAPLALGLRRPDVKEFKEDLTAAGFTPWTRPNENYGPETVEYVKNFQAYYNLPITGVGDEATQAKLAEILNSPYQSGKSSKAIQELKVKLKLLGFADHWTNPNENYGPETVDVVKAFQSHYGLVTNGIVDEVTYAKIEEVFNSSLQNGSTGEKVREFKKNLTTVGFTPWTNPNEHFGPETEEYVKSFQAFYGLPITGKGDHATLNQLSKILNSPYQLGKQSEAIREIKNDLMLLGFANHWYNPNTNYGPETVKVVQDFQAHHGLPVSGIVDEVTYSVIKSQMNNRVFTEYDVSFNHALDMQMRVTPQTDRNYAYVSKNYIDRNNKVTAPVLNVRSGNGTNKLIVGTLAKGDQVEIIREINGWYQIEYSDAYWVDAVREDTAYYLNPSNFANNPIQSFQFLNLSRLSGATPAELNGYLKGRGILEGTGQAFIEAGRTYGVNEVYLLSHALLETGHGTSKLATGIEVNGETVYNVFGIGAYDSDPNHFGSLRAYEEGWTTPEKAIIGGARFIGNNYITAGQNTLYKMRWNPAAMSNLKYATHQYATDIGWASKQVYTINRLYNDIGIQNIFLDIPVYK